MTHHIIVLEDEPTRVDWLTAHVPDGTHIHHATTVESFEELLMEFDPSLVILDHDLGDADPEHTGLDAAASIPANAAYLVVVWSVNPVGARMIHADLTQHGVACILHPFMLPLTHFQQLLDIVLSPCEP